MMTGFSMYLLAWHFLIFLPAMAANGAPLVTGRLLRLRGKKTHPVDGGRKFIDGKPLLGKSKTIEGAVAGIIVGTIVGLLIWVFADSYFIEAGFIGGLGAVLGDMIGSFIKRRFNVPPGHDFPVLDQLDFAVFAALLLWALGVPLDPVYTLVMLPIIFVLHVSTNKLAAKTLP
ncbi:MAG: CDP-archaeol synthase [Desulfurococcales archaeon]|nr:CDP-archaeol synthase [Desulfurococcales archaeon]